MTAFDVTSCDSYVAQPTSSSTQEDAGALNKSFQRKHDKARSDVREGGEDDPQQKNALQGPGRKRKRKRIEMKPNEGRWVG